MGITGLLQALQPIATDLNIAALANKAVAIDAYCWLHRGAYACAMELAQNQKTDVFVNFCMKRAAMMIHHKVRPVFVFDGDYLPAKKGKEGERKQRREENRAKGMALLRAGNRSGALECFQKCIDVTPEMAFQLIQACRRENIEYFVAPYEADAQLAYLCHVNHVQAVVTEDSDLLVYGCARVIFKMDQFGNGREIQSKYLCSRHGENGLDLEGWPHDRFRQLCILAGCDYLDSAPGVGLKTAYKLLKKHGDAGKVIQALRGQGTALEAEYDTKFQKAELTFKYHLVWDPHQQRVVPFTPYPADGEFDASQLLFAGPPFDPERIVGHVRGDLNPFTGEPMLPAAPPPKIDEVSSQSQGLGQLDASQPVSGRPSPLVGVAELPRVPSAPSVMPSSAALFARYGTIKSRPDTAPPQKNTLDSFVKRDRKPAVDVSATEKALADFAPPARVQEPMASIMPTTANPFMQPKRVKVASKYFVRPDQLTDLSKRTVSATFSVPAVPAAAEANSQSTDSLQGELAAATEAMSSPPPQLDSAAATLPKATSPSLALPVRGLSAPAPSLVNPNAVGGRVSPVFVPSSQSSGASGPPQPCNADSTQGDEDDEIFIVGAAAAAALPPPPPPPRIKLGLARPSSKATPPLKSPASVVREGLSRFRFSPALSSAPVSPASVPASPSASTDATSAVARGSFFRSPSTPSVLREARSAPRLQDPLADSGIFPSPVGSLSRSAEASNSGSTATCALPLDLSMDDPEPMDTHAAPSPPRAQSPVIPPKRVSATAALAERFGFKRSCPEPR